MAQLTTALSVLERRLGEQISDYLEVAVGTIKRGKEIGKLNTSHKFIFSECIDCRVKRWVLIEKKRPVSYRCKACYCKKRNGADNPNWDNGKYKDAKAGYIYIKIFPEDFFYSMADKRGYVRENRLVMAKHLNRCLLTWEIVHHINGVKDDDRIENLKLLSSKLQHLPDTLLKSKLKRQDERIKDLEARVTLLEAENVLLKNEGITQCLN